MLVSSKRGEKGAGPIRLVQMFTKNAQKQQYTHTRVKQQSDSKEIQLTGHLFMLIIPGEKPMTFSITNGWCIPSPSPAMDRGGACYRFHRLYELQKIVSRFYVNCLHHPILVQGRNQWGRPGSQRKRAEIRNNLHSQ